MHMRKPEGVVKEEKQRKKYQRVRGGTKKGGGEKFR